MSKEVAAVRGRAGSDEEEAWACFFFLEVGVEGKSGVSGRSEEKKKKEEQAEKNGKKSSRGLNLRSMILKESRGGSIFRSLQHVESVAFDASG